MQFSERRNVTRWTIIVASFFIITLILWNTYTFFQIFKNEERVKMQNWALAQKKINTADPNADIELPFQIIQEASIPIIVTNKDSIINTNNIDIDILKDKIKLNAFLKKLKNQNEPIIMKISDNNIHKLYYGDSSLLNKLKYYPIALLLIIVFLLSFSLTNGQDKEKVKMKKALMAWMLRHMPVKNSSKIFPMYSGSMPIPVSLTRIVICVS